MTGIIYKVTNKSNSKIYIGQTIQKFEERKRGHISAIGKRKKETHFSRALQKHGLDNFVWEVIEEVEIENLSEREIYWIKYFKSYDKNLGYNRTFGGEGGVPTLETRQKLSLRSKGERNPMFGKPAVLRRSIICLQNLKVYTSIRECAEELNIPESNIIAVLKHKALSSQGYSFSYYSPNEIYQKQEKLFRYTRIICEQTGEIFQSLRACSMAFKMHTDTIEKCIVSGKAIRGYTFKEYTDNIEYPKKPKVEKVKKVYRKKSSKIRGIRIICEQNLTVYPSLVNAAKVLNLPKAQVSQHLNGHVNQVRGYTFRWYDSNEKYSQKELLNSNVKKKIICHQTEITYESLTEASKSLQVSVSNIVYALKNKSHAKGFTFSYIK
jgi:group I intron endonuclease